MFELLNLIGKGLAGIIQAQSIVQQGQTIIEHMKTNNLDQPPEEMMVGLRSSVASLKLAEDDYQMMIDNAKAQNNLE